MLSLRIALRYLFSHKTHNAVNILSLVSVLGVAIATAAMVIVLSVFNGFRDLAAGKLSVMDPDLMVVPANGSKVIANADSLAGLIGTLPGVAVARPVVKEQALAVAGDIQRPVTMLGLDTDVVSSTGLRDIIIDGVPLVGRIDAPGTAVNGMDACVLSVGAAVETGLRAGMNTDVSIYVPRRTARINTANPMNAFRADTLVVAGVYRVEQAEYDTDMIIVPLDVARSLLEYHDGQGSDIHIYAGEGTDVDALKSLIAREIGGSWSVLDRIEQQQQAFKMIAVEKWITLLMLAFILIITSFNIISSTYILKVEKQGNMAVLRSMGALPSMIRGIFRWQCRLITLAGGVLGLLIGTTLTLVQQYGHIIKLHAGDMSMLAVEAYPVRLESLDLLVVTIIVIAVAAVCSRLSTASRL